MPELIHIVHLNDQCYLFDLIDQANDFARTAKLKTLGNVNVSIEIVEKERRNENEFCN